METSDDFQKQKERLIKNVEQIEDALLIQAINSMIDFANQKQDDYLGESIREYNLALEQADAEIEKGNFLVHEEAMKKIGEWRKEDK